MQATIEYWRGRATRLTLAVIVHVVAIFLAYFLSPPIQFKKPSNDLSVIMLPAPAEQKKAPRHSAQARRQRPNALPVPKPLVPPVDRTEGPLNMIYVSSEVFQASDISKIPPRDAPDERAMAGVSPDRGTGEGPGGATLYPVEWYREPTQAEMATYLPKNGVHSGYGYVACKTATDYRVEDCHEISEAPAGSGFARSLRLASWQFKVRPPRINGKPMIGVWIGIRYDIIEGFKR
jgi:protein TonB